MGKGNGKSLHDLFMEVQEDGSVIPGPSKENSKDKKKTKKKK